MNDFENDLDNMLLNRNGRASEKSLDQLELSYDMIEKDISVISDKKEWSQTITIDFLK